MIGEAIRNNKKIFIGIDEVSRTKEMIVFASEFGKWLRSGYPVYLVCTGLYENIQELSNVKNLTFFRRAVTKQTCPLNAVKMAELYKNKLHVDISLARKMAAVTKGYAYAFQELGKLYFKKQGSHSLEEVMDELKSELFAYSYEKIWEELAEGDRFVLRLLCDREERKRQDILENLGERANQYSVYRDRLKKRGLIAVRPGYISLSLPFFGEYIRDYGAPDNLFG